MRENIIETKGLTKRFGKFTAVAGINLQIKEGEIFGLLGPNGAGKTTTINMLTTLIKPTAGQVAIGGYDLAKQGSEIRAIIGVVPQTFSLFPELTPEENLSYIGQLYGIAPEKIKQRTKELLETVSLYDHRGRISGIFSGGMKQRLSLAASIMSSPKILFMDEPTTGLDPQSRIAIRELTEKLNSEGMTIVYTTHDMEEAEKICDTINIMDKGNIIAKGTDIEIKHMIKEDHLVEIEIANPAKEIISELKKLPFVVNAHLEKGLINVYVKNKEGVFYKLTDFMHTRNQKVNEIRFKEHSLEDVFIHLTKKDLRD